MRYINPYLMDSYCGITVVNYGLIRLIRFVSRISTQLSKKIINRFYLILQNTKILFDVTGLQKVAGNKQHLSLVDFRSLV